MHVNKILLGNQSAYFDNDLIHWRTYELIKAVRAGKSSAG